MWGGVGTTVNAKEITTADDVSSISTYADESVLELTVNFVREARVFNDNYNNEFSTIDLTEAKKFLGLTNTTIDVNFLNNNKDFLRIIKSDGQYDDNTGVNYYYSGEYKESPHDGWFTADGNPTTWGTSSAVCVKFFQALLNDGKYEICDMFTDANNKTATVKWALEYNGKKVIYTINVIFANPSYTKTYTVDKSNLTGNKVPKLWGYYGESGKIKMYMGGWKYQDNNGYAINMKDGDKNIVSGGYYATDLQSELAGLYDKTNSYYLNNSNSPKADYWEICSIITNYGDGDNDNKVYYQYYFPGYRYKSFGKGDNARSEFVEYDTRAGKGVPGKYNEVFRGFGKGNPFTVPCFGTFLKFEPEQNGTVVLYIAQNGLIDLSAKNEGESGLSDNVKWRPTYIVDELGNQLTDRDGVTAELPKTRSESNDESGQNAVTDDVGQKIYIGHDGTYNNKKWGDTGFELANGKDNNESVIEAFTAGVRALQQDSKKAAAVWDVLINEYWGTGGSEMKMMPPSASQDGWIAINKTYVKYTFRVKAGKSYYVLNNDSQIGFCGYDFIPEKELDNGITIDDENYTPKPGSYKSVTVKRSFKQGWNAICLPFSVTESKMRAAFGSDGKTEDYELVTYNGCRKTSEEGDGIPTTENGLTAHFFRHAYQDILAGYPYMIYIPKGAAALSGSITFSNITIEDNVEMATFNNSTEYMDSNDYCTKKDLSKETDFTFKGTYVPETIPAGSYVVYSNITADKQDAKTGIRYLEESDNIKGLRSYLYPEYRYQTPESVKAVARITGTNFSDVLDESIWNDATVINGLMEEMGFFDQKENVYSITGQLVRQNSTSLVGLPKGIYIVKGKKYFVK